tara:strand:+ start:1368 stop:1685 length:318 start_codon:yes stop_codon:yes gene_type:complete
MDKIDTQGMSGPANSGGTDNIYPHDENGEPILPRAVITPHRLHTHQMVKELKIIINEVLDEREHKRRLEGAYDDVKPLPPSYFDVEHFKHLIDEPEPEYKDWSQS